MNFKTKKSLSFLITFAIVLSCSVLLSKQASASLNADQTAQSFFSALERNNKEDAYALFAKGLSQIIAFNQFEEFMDILQERWGRIESEETALMPFHKRTGERDFIPLNTPEESIKRYIFDLKYEHAEINCDLTLVREGNQYKIVWLSFWGSSVYMTPEINSKIQELFSSSLDTDQ